ncbi:hypothetical protein HK405_006977 [Cladochytrium tenue]|nr:hypothetical protein HK405_006977 [Cladochytrium tenue]
MTSAESAPALPPYFPLKLRKEKDVGRKALVTCAEQLKLYQACMDKHKHLLPKSSFDLTATTKSGAVIASAATSAASSTTRFYIAI